MRADRSTGSINIGKDRSARRAEMEMLASAGCRARLVNGNRRDIRRFLSQFVGENVLPIEKKDRNDLVINYRSLNNDNYVQFSSVQ